MRLIGQRTITLDGDQDAILVLDSLRRVLRAEVRSAYVEHLIRQQPVDPEELFFRIVGWIEAIHFLRDLVKTTRIVFERVAPQLDDCEETIKRLRELLGREEASDAEGQ